ncbi:cell adhesion protein byn-1 [Ramaria rubella]|nr:cell adhesion protein byn-1 [Ramaria rubella]
MPKAANSKKTKKNHHDPLHVQIKEDEVASKYGKVSRLGKRSKKQTLDEENDEVIFDSKTSRRIFELAKDQQDELDSLPDDGDGYHQLRSRSEDEFNEEEEDSIPEGSVGDKEYAELQIDEEDMRTFDTLMPSNAGERRTLADLIFSKLSNAEESSENLKVSRQQRSTPDPALGLNPKVVEVYTKVGIILSRYKSGALPKAFKMIPSLPQWARILALTNPTQWTPHATLAATRIFISNLKPEQARVFLEGILLERVRTNIQENHEGRKLDVQLYGALKKAIYKPGAFFKGILFPLLQGGCTLKEGAIVASVLSKVSVPVLHAAAALGRLAGLSNYSGPNSLFIRILLDKKHALPYKTLDSLVNHFIRLSNTYKAGVGESEHLPVLWHQSLLVFCQRYASDLAPDQNDALLDVVRANPHPQISPEIRRELVNAVSRSEPRSIDPDVDMI